MIRAAPHLTCNQAMVLLDIYRGTFEKSRHLATVDMDIRRLIEYEYIEGKDSFFTTQLGEARVATMLS